MRIPNLILLFVSVMASAAAVPAQISTPMLAIFLKAACIEKTDYSKGFCNGAIDAHYSNITDWCVPADVTHREVQEYLREEITSRNWPANVSAFEAISRAVQRQWPCAY